jgi:hypothetical protein
VRERATHRVDGPVKRWQLPPLQRTSEEERRLVDHPLSVEQQFVDDARSYPEGVPASERARRHT